MLGEGDEDEAVVAAAAAVASPEAGEPEGPDGAQEEVDKAATAVLYADTGDALVRALRYV